MRITVGQLVANLMDVNNANLHDDHLAAIATECQLTEWLIRHDEATASRWDLREPGYTPSREVR